MCNLSFRTKKVAFKKNGCARDDIMNTKRIVSLSRDFFSVYWNKKISAESNKKQLVETDCSGYASNNNAQYIYNNLIMPNWSVDQRVEINVTSSLTPRNVSHVPRSLTERKFWQVHEWPMWLCQHWRHSDLRNTISTSWLNRQPEHMRFSSVVWELSMVIVDVVLTVFFFCV